MDIIQEIIKKIYDDFEILKIIWITIVLLHLV